MAGSRPQSNFTHLKAALTAKARAKSGLPEELALAHARRNVKSVRRRP